MDHDTNLELYIEKYFLMGIVGFIHDRTRRRGYVVIRIDTGTSWPTYLYVNRFQLPACDQEFGSWAEIESDRWIGVPGLSGEDSVEQEFAPLDRGPQTESEWLWNDDLLLRIWDCLGRLNIIFF